MGDTVFQAQQSQLAEDLRSSLAELCTSEPDPDLIDLLFAWSVASSSTFILGRAAGVNLLRDLPAARRLREEYNAQRANSSWTSLIPIPGTWFRWVGLPVEVEWIRKMQDRFAEGTLAGPTTDTAEARSTPYGYLKAAMEGKGRNDGKFNQLSTKDMSEISSEMQDHVIAGIDTSLAALAACAWQLSLEHNREWQNKLRDEVRPFHGQIQARDIDQLPILNAVIKETLRLFPPAAGCQPRVTNRTMDISRPGCPASIPAGRTVHAQAWTLHRNNDVFDRPEEWLPARWLSCNREERKTMDAWFWAFGSGSRKCIGEFLADGSLKVAIAAIWSRFETQATEKTKFALSQGLLALPIPTDGYFIRLNVHRVETSQES
jgi:unspecific monooxygenase